LRFITRFQPIFGAYKSLINNNNIIVHIIIYLYYYAYRASSVYLYNDIMYYIVLHRRSGGARDKKKKLVSCQNKTKYTLCSCCCVAANYKQCNQDINNPFAPRRRPFRSAIVCALAISLGRRVTQPVSSPYGVSLLHSACSFIISTHTRVISNDL